MGDTRYHIGRQHNGRGWMILRLSALHAGLANTKATVIECDLPEDVARAHLAAYRREESTAALGNPPAPGGPR